MGGITTRTKSDFCYGGKTEKKDWLRNKDPEKETKYCNNPYNTDNGKLDAPLDCFALNRGELKAEHTIYTKGSNSRTDLDFGFSYDVVTHTVVGGQGSLLNFIRATNHSSGKSLGTGQMLFCTCI